MPEEKKVRGKKKKQQKKKDPKKLEILNDCAALGRACNKVGDFDDAKRYFKRTKEGYEEQLGRNSEKALDANYWMVTCTAMSEADRIEKTRDLVKRMERALGEENVVTLETRNSLGNALSRNEQYEEAKEVHEKCLAGRMKALGEEHRDSLDTLTNLGGVYNDGFGNFEKAAEYFERAYKGSERLLGTNHPTTLSVVECISNCYSGFASQRAVTAQGSQN
ncbi:hypothetical protein TrLO_g4040 [Triparma laevis f. longispina]|uniref:Kinesin light chain n=1 Tax=Triparma laevis f. longispina TaxID=1714387 RepID=A0A9W7AVG0_9STRA|nr:hypothetical protein TrLO_g4040 [Triparma laevis f. longispina]